MFRFKVLIVLAGMVAALAISAIPAGAAEWTANASAEKEAEGQGKVVVLKSGEFVDEGAKVKCPEAGIVATWSIQTKGQIKVHNEKEKQLKSKKGPHLNFFIKWGAGCTGEIAGVKVGAAVVSDCELQLVASSTTTATGGSVTTCRIKTGGCEVIVPAGMETEPQSNKGWNVGLSEVKLANSGNNQIDKINVGGILGVKSPNAGCPLHLVQTSELKEGEFEVVGATIA